MSQRRSILISNNVLTWIAVRNNFHQHLRIECPFANSEIDRFISLVDETETKINVLSETYTEKNEILLLIAKGCRRTFRLIKSHQYSFGSDQESNSRPLGPESTTLATTPECSTN